MGTIAKVINRIDRVDTQGTLINFSDEQFTLVLSIMLGIRKSVQFSRLLEGPVFESDFQTEIWFEL